ncbi:uncharacterized protein MONOS_16157 [Monocercomonoides exilis]|uniref:uncharacterized protein n=1 Tax=Monocercomonoides exilis TaxID=2049356 RepID=UPI00355A32BD|nr:hypothetical protein MONOS_16157 [Monocercomonoides exilis]|eukprot:MONOS_16157.1-p1 / transcript=MONOS_16157.1 / gene=MONOS_16157 / organism=Monocercomonoides_exilis_PA203 / gene_product=unspecified product / transcript_product=unspecified product / location=Mono_scaffold01533:1293-1595(-) / protein_length=101 / sequence_SO=supercontig / SO=protein_coding / is_pseudo=false
MAIGVLFERSTTLFVNEIVLHFLSFSPHALWSIPSSPFTFISSKNPDTIHPLTSLESFTILQALAVIVRHSTNDSFVIICTHLSKMQMSWPPFSALLFSK